jgi:hypothetical protein
MDQNNQNQRSRPRPRSWNLFIISVRNRIFSYLESIQDSLNFVGWEDCVHYENNRGIGRSGLLGIMIGFIGGLHLSIFGVSLLFSYSNFWFKVIVRLLLSHLLKFIRNISIVDKIYRVFGLCMLFFYHYSIFSNFLLLPLNNQQV